MAVTVLARAQYQDNSQITPLPTGGWALLTHTRGRDDTLLQFFDARGQSTSAVFTLAPLHDHGDVAMTALPDGRVAVIWGEQKVTEQQDTLVVQTFTAAGPTGPAADLMKLPRLEGLDVSTAGPNQVEIAWSAPDFSANPPSSSLGVGRLDLATRSITSVYSGRGAYNAEPDVAHTTGGGIAAAWTLGDGFTLPERYDVMQGMFAGGAAVARVGGSAAGFQEQPQVAALRGGGYVVVWQSASGSEANVHDVWLQQFDAAGVGAAPRLITASAVRDQQQPAVMALGDGGYLVAYASDHSGSGTWVYLQRYDASGAPVGEAEAPFTSYGDRLLGAATEIRLSQLADGSVAVAWQAVDSNINGYNTQVAVVEFTPGAHPLIDAVENVMRREPWTAEATRTLLADYDANRIDRAPAIEAVVDLADATTSVATLSYQFFTGRVPSSGGLDFLVAPTGPNPNNINSAYYQSFSLENRYINFAVNLGKAGEGRAAFEAAYGPLTLFEATRKAYETIFGAAPSDAKVSALLDPTVDLGGRTMTRAQYFDAYGQDGPNGVGTKAAMVGWLLAEAVKADLGQYARANDAFLTDLADGAAYGVDLVGVYGRPEYVYHPG